MKKLFTLLLLTLLIPTAIYADNHSPQQIADSWVMIVKSGHESKFQDAMKAHLAYRKANGEKRTWDTYTPVTGENLNQYIVRTCCNTWAEQDAHVADAAKYSEHFNKNVHPHVKKYTHNLTVIDMENSNWPEDTDASFVGVTSYKPIVGKGGARGESLKAMSAMAKEKGWPRNWAWTYPVGGDGSWTLVTPFENYADMAPMEESFYDFTKKHMGSAEKADALFQKFSSSFSETHYAIYRHNKELSTLKD